MAKSKLVGYTLALLLFSVGCTNTPAVQDSLGANEINFLRGKNQSSGGGDTALVEGVLKLSNGCLLVTDEFGSTFSPVWPRDYNYRRVADNLEIVGGSGEVVAEVGKRVGLGGGEFSDIDYAELTKSVSGDLNCPQPFWDVNTVQ